MIHLSSLQGITVGPDGYLYGTSNGVKRYNNLTGEDTGMFATHASINNAVDLAFGPDGNLYVTSHLTSEIYRFNGTTGAFIDVFANSSSGLNGPTGLTFGPDGKLYVCSAWGNQILRYNTSTKQREVVANVTLGHDIVFDSDDFFYVSAYLNDTLYKYNINGVLQETIDSNGVLDQPYGMAFYSDGDLYISNKPTIMTYDGEDFTQFAPVNGESIYTRFLVFQDQDVAAIPEPLSSVLLLSALSALFWRRKK